MRCPYCSSDMEEGYIVASHGAYWVKRTRSLFLFPRRKKGDVVLSGLWSGSSGGSAYLCRSCNKVIMDVNGYSSAE